uniref:phosphoserine transaminase n=1 Tax=Saccoglossus kowalevskii TaxID=10224 RepID=A0ABM0GSR7_SACKO|nr:PREDICTED: phosphoserine aminotransferase-like [Saccoglossus kowalevskii]
MSEGRVINFAAGPAKLPEAVLQRAQKEMLNYQNTGVSVMGKSLRHFPIFAINIPMNYKILFLQGGGTGLMAAVALNLMNRSESKCADYVVTGTWSAKAAKEAEKYGSVNRVLPKTSKYRSKLKLYGVIFAGAQKNIGCAGVTLAIVRDDLLGHAMPSCPAILDFKGQSDANSLYNTPPAYSIYIMGLVFEWLKEQGGSDVMDERSAIKAKSIYDVIDESNGFYCCPVDPSARSRMNIVFRVGGPDGTEELEKKFVSESTKRKMVSIKGHRSVGGMRISLYNAITLEETFSMAQFMTEFQANHQ